MKDNKNELTKEQVEKGLPPYIYYIGIYKQQTHC